MEEEASINSAGRKNGDDPDAIREEGTNQETREVTVLDGHSKPELLPQIAAASFMAINGFWSGFVIAYSAVAFPSFLNDPEKPFQFTIHHRAIFASGFNLALIFGALTGAPVGRRWGSKWPLIFIMVPKCLSWLLIAYPVNPAMMISGRLVQGFLNGIHVSLAQIYTTEIAHKLVRGLLLSSFMIWLAIGQLSTYTIGAFVNWRIMALIAGGLPLVFVPLLTFLPLSPIWLVKKGQDKEALEAMIWLRGKRYDSQGEIKGIKDHMEAAGSDEPCYKDLLKAINLKPLLLVCFFLALRQFSGYFAVVFFTVDIFRAAGSTINPNIAAIIVGSIILTFTVTSAVVVDRLGRKRLAVCSAFVMMLAQATFASYFVLNSKKVSAIGWLPLVALMGFVAAFSLGIANLMYIAMGEIIPGRIKAVGTGVCLAANNVSQFAVLQSFEYLRTWWGNTGVFWFYTATNAALFLVCFFLLPETSGKSLEELDAARPKSRASINKTNPPDDRPDANGAFQQNNERART